MWKVIGLLALVILTTVSVFLFTNVGDTNELNTEVAEVAESKYDKAPQFSLKDYEGNVVSSNYSGKKVTVVNSWTTWCPFCVDELPDFALLQEEFSDEIDVIAIDRSESLDKAKKFSDELGVTGRIGFLMDPKDSFYQSIGGFSMPETIFVDSEGNILIHKRGPMRFEEMKQKIDQILLDLREEN